MIEVALATVKKETTKQEAESIEIEELIGTIEISDHKSLGEAVSFVAEIKRQYKEVEKKRKTISEPLTKATKELNALFKGPTVPLARAETSLKTKIVEYTTGCYTEREKLLTDVAGMTKASDKQKAIKKAEAFIPPKVPGLAISEFWGGDVLDPAAVKEWAIENNRTELLLINEKVLQEFTKAANKDPEIAGWCAAKKIRIAITESKVKK